MIKLHVEFDIKIMEETGHNWNDFVENLITNVLPIINFVIEEKDDNGYLLIKGPDKNTDLAHQAQLVTAFKENDFTKRSLKKLLLLDNADSKDGSFYVDSDWIKSWKECNLW